MNGRMIYWYIIVCLDVNQDDDTQWGMQMFSISVLLDHWKLEYCSVNSVKPVMFCVESVGVLPGFYLCLTRKVDSSLDWGPKMMISWVSHCNERENIEDNVVAFLHAFTSRLRFKTDESCIGLQSKGIKHLYAKFVKSGLSLMNVHIRCVV